MNRTYCVDPEVSLIGDLYSGVAGEWSSDFILNAQVHTLLLGFERLSAEYLDLLARLKLRDRVCLAVVQTDIDAQLPGPRTKPIATFRQVIEPHLVFPFSKINAETAQTHRCAYFRVAETVWRRRHGQKPIYKKGIERVPSDFSVADQPLTIIDSQFDFDYEFARVDGLIPETIAWRMARRLARTDLKWFRRMFRCEAKTALVAAGVNIPADVYERIERLGEELEAVKREVKFVDEDHVRAMHRLLWRLANGPDELLFLIVALALRHGLRHDEIATLKRSSLQKSTEYGLAIRLKDEYISGVIEGPKTSPRIIPVDPWFWDRLMAWFDRQPEHCLIPPGPGREDIMELVTGYLREHGCGAFPLHQLRGYFAGYLLANRPFDEVGQIFGHEDLITMWTYYINHVLADAVCRDWEMILPAFATGYRGVTV